MEKHEMDLREWLSYHRDHRQIGKILTMVGEGIKELHSMVYVHRDLKPDNVVVSLRPLSAKLIDFERAQPRTLTTVGHVRGTAGYFPERENLKDGSTKWDSYALAAMALECDMEKDAYLHVMTERGAKAKVNEYINEKGTCPELRNLLRRTLLAHDADDILEINEIMQAI